MPDGTTTTNPKEEGQGIMLSCYVSRDFGFGFDLNKEDLERVNTYRENKEYLDKEAAMKLNNSVMKPKLTTSPFVCTFQYGQNLEGYWTYDHSILQLEDVCDVLKVIFADKYDYVFYFDHSSGHDRLRPDGLNVNQMNKMFGGTQSQMRDTKILDDTYLGPFEHPTKLKIGDTQKMTFDVNDNGPFWMSDQERVDNKFDCELEKDERKKYTRAQLIEMIQIGTNLVDIKGNLSDVQKLACNSNIPIEYTRKRKKEGWSNKAKGMLQVLFERGLIDASMSKQEVLRYYTIDGRKDNITGNLLPGTSLRKMIADLPDFKSEITLLQYRAKQLGVEVDCSPKYHCEIAGEAIEYCWGLSKNKYRVYSISRKRTKDKYLELINECICNKTVITKRRVRLFGRKIRRYMLAYLSIEITKQENFEAAAHAVPDLKLPEMSSSLVEKIVKIYKSPKKSHRNVRDHENKMLVRMVCKVRSSVFDAISE